MVTSDTDTGFRVESPCVRKCALDSDDVCVGCFRSMDEICAWGVASNARRQEILLQAARRREMKAGRA